VGRGAAYHSMVNFSRQIRVFPLIPCAPASAYILSMVVFLGPPTDRYTLPRPLFPRRPTGGPLLNRLSTTVLFRLLPFPAAAGFFFPPLAAAEALVFFTDGFVASRFRGPFGLLLPLSLSESVGSGMGTELEWEGKSIAGGTPRRTAPKPLPAAVFPRVDASLFKLNLDAHTHDKDTCQLRVFRTSQKACEMHAHAREWLVAKIERHCLPSFAQADRRPELVLH